MKNYVFVYYNEPISGDMPMKEVAKVWKAWFGELGASLVDAGNPFADGGQAVEKSGVSTIENHPATGYTIVKAASMDDAVALAQGCPVLDVPGGAVRVYETLPM
ncbi:MAG TPA: hypothetical protein VMT30_03885 [Candidatus Saccharimonadia bacterium]|nr:hypothetical protein [Candidatus Saccharimonadia bacterium]